MEIKNGHACGSILAQELTDEGLDVIAMLLEAGSELTGAFVRAGLVDRVAAFVAPKLLGGAAAPTAAGGAGLPLGDALRLAELTARPLGDDWLLEGRVER